MCVLTIEICYYICLVVLVLLMIFNSMNYKAFILAVFCWLILLPAGRSQVFDQAKLLSLLPEVPSNLSTATEEEVFAFSRHCDSINNLLTSYEEKYKRSNDADETNSERIMEYYDIRDSILDVHSTMRNKYYDLVVFFSDLEYELSVKNSVIEETIGNIRYDAEKKEELTSLYNQVYANKVECSQKQVAIYLQFLNEYFTRLNNLAWRANKSETIPLPDHLNKDVSYVLLNVQKYLNYLSEVYKFNIGPAAMEE